MPARDEPLTSNQSTNKRFHWDEEEQTLMRRLTAFLIPTLALGTLLATGCAEHRYQTNDPYYGYRGYDRGQDPYYRQWLAERRYNYVEYNRLNSGRQREYWEWRRQNEARFRNDPRFRDNQRVERGSQGASRNDHDADDRGRTYARTRDGDRDRHQDDKDRHKVRDRDHDKRDKDKRDKDDHDRDRDRR